MPAIVQTETEIVIPPPEWTEPTPYPPLQGTTIADGENHEAELDAALRMCNGDKAAMRKYIEEQTKLLMEGNTDEN